MESYNIDAVLNKAKVKMTWLMEAKYGHIKDHWIHEQRIKDTVEYKYTNVFPHARKRIELTEMKYKSKRNQRLKLT